jgi:hypothetical protein
LSNSITRFLKVNKIEFEHEKQLGIVTADFYLPKKQAAIEVDGPAHFVIHGNRRYSYNATTLAKHRMVVGNKEVGSFFVMCGNVVYDKSKSFDSVTDRILDLYN